ncbi:MAG: PilW family protein [Nitrospirae bacterium]|nr:PilW family protein [Nitrospirota bacterium]
MKMRILDESGYSMAELMISIMLSSILMAAAYATYTTQTRSYARQENTGEVNTQARIALGILTEDIKSEGFGVPADMNSEPINGRTAPIVINDAGNGPDAITLVSGFRQIGTLQSAVASGATQIRISYGGTAIHPNSTDRRYISIDGVSFNVVTITQNDPVFTLRDAVPISFPAGRPVYLVEDVTYCVSFAAGQTAGELRRIRRNANAARCEAANTSDTEVIAGNVEDMQLAYAVDADASGAIDDQNGNGRFDDGDYLYNGTNAGLITSTSTIKAVRVSILARSPREDASMSAVMTPPASIENRSRGNADVVTDHFVRRLWTGMAARRSM